MQSTMKLAILVAFAVLVQVNLSTARAGGRGGGGGKTGGSRGGSRGSRGSSSRGSSRVSRYNGYQAAIAAHVAVSGMPRYRTRYYGTKDYNSNPTVCYTTGTGKFDNGTYTANLGYFVCPFALTDEASDTYCCGPRDRQECCGFWEDPGRAAGTIIGIIIGVVLIVITIVCVVKFCFKKGHNFDDASNVSVNSIKDHTNDPPLYTDNHSVDTPGYPLSSVETKPGYEYPASAPPQQSDNLIKPDAP